MKRASVFLFVIGVLLSLPTFAQTRIAAQDASLAATAHGLAFGQSLRIEALGMEGTGDALTLHRFQVWADDAKIVVHGDNGTQVLGHSDHAYFSGRVDGVRGSRAVMTVRSDGSVHGVVAFGGRWFMLSNGDGLLAATEVDAAFARESPGFSCEADALREVPAESRDAAPQHQPGTSVALGGSGTYNVTVAAETDFEYYNKFGNASDASDYIADLIAYGSSIYADEVDTNMLLGDVSLWSTSSDPWAQTNSGCALYEFGGYWNTNNTGVSRTIAHMFSGKSTNSGVAWVGVLCQSAFNYDTTGCGLSPNVGSYGGGYGFTGGIDGDFDINSPAAIWDIVAVTHEIGHNFNSPHTHCYAGLEGNASPIDECYGTQPGANCYAGSTSLPCGTIGAGCGTLMSYCHLLSGGMSNISLTLGLGHPHGIEPERVSERMSAHVVSRAGSNPGCITTGCTAPSISATGGNLTRCAGEAAVFSVTASNADSYQWKKNGVAIGGATSATYTIPSVVSGDAATYTCTVTNACDSVTSSGDVLTVPAATVVGAVGPDQDVCSGDPASFTVSATGSNLTYQWRKDTVAVPGATSATYAPASVSPADAGTYDCVVTGTCGSGTSAGISLTVEAAPSITGQPTGLVRCIGESAVFTVTASGADSYQWQRNGSNIGGAVTATLTLDPVSGGDAGSYRCIVTNGCGDATSNAVTLTVNTPVDISAQSGSLDLCTGAQAQFSVTATGTGLSYQWRKNGGSIGGATAATYTIAAVSTGDAGSYDCVVTGSCGSETSTGAALTVSAALTINSQPADDTVCVGEDSGFQVVKGGGHGTVTYQWYHDGVALGGETASSLTLLAVDAGDAGSYHCVLSDDCDTLSSTVRTLTVLPAAALTAQPADASRCVGDPVTFSVSATGSNLTYQWQLDMVDLPGETDSSLHIPAVSPGDEGDYRCSIESDCGGLTSETATLTLTGGSFSVDATASALVQGLNTITLDGAVICGGAGVDVTWYNLTAGGNYGVGVNPYTFPAALEETTLFEAVADNGSSTVSAQVWVVASPNPAFLDLNGDGCNTIVDLYLILHGWNVSGFSQGDANGDGRVDVRDYLHINVTDGCP